MGRAKTKPVQLSLLPRPKVLVKLTELEINRNILIIGHRLAPIQNPEIQPWELAIQSESGAVLKTSTAAITLKDITIFYNLYGDELLIPMIMAQDETNMPVLIRNDKSASNVIIRALVFDMGSYYTDQGLGAGDYLEFQGVDDQAKQFTFRPVKAQDISVDERTAFFAALDEAVVRAMKHLKTPQDPITMIRTIFQMACQDICEKPAASFSEYYNTGDKLTVVTVWGHSYMWKKGVDIRPLVSKKQEFIPPISRKDNELNDAFDAMGLALSADEVEAFVRDELYHGRGVDEALQRCFIGLESVGYPEPMIRDIYKKTRAFAKEIAKDWRIEDEPKEVAELRARVLLIYERFLIWMRDIEAIVESEKDLAQTDFLQLSQAMNVFCSLIPILNDAVNEPILLQNLKPIVGKLRSMESLVNELMSAVALDLKSHYRKGVQKETVKNKKKTRKRPASKKNYVFKIELAYIEPSIYRKVLIPGNRTLNEVSKIILAAMGWWDSHLHSFKIRGQLYGIPSAEDWEPVMDERKVRLDDLNLRKGSRFLFEYDFGDSWEHYITVIETQKADPDHEETPTVLDGSRACPPEDSGGVPGYYDIIDTLAIPEAQRSSDDQELIDWLPPGYDPEAFDIKDANGRLKKL